LTKTSKQRLVFLLGSGISIPAKMPKLYEITEKVLSGQGISYYTGIFPSHVPPFVDLAKKLKEEGQQENVWKVTKFLRRLKTEIEDYYKKHPFKLDTSYEDLYYMASQIYYSELGQYDNPAVQPLIDKIFPEIKFLLKKTNTGYERTLSQLAEEAMKYIEYVVSFELTKEPQTLDYLDCVKDCIKEYCENKDFAKVDIFTLNHDSVLEKFLKQSRILFTDGFFKPRKEKHRYWKPSLFNNGFFKVRLFKLHGSINWFRLKPKDMKDLSHELIGIPFVPEMDNLKIKDNRGRIIQVKEQLLLVGTYNKMLEYTSGIFRELHYRFYDSLSKVRQLVICGYGLEDHGINTQIIDWLYSSQSDRRIILIDPHPETLKNKNSIISNKWDELIKANKLKVLQKGIENVCWQDLKYLLRQNI